MKDRALNSFLRSHLLWNPPSVILNGVQCNFENMNETEVKIKSVLVVKKVIVNLLLEGYKF